jgi:5'-deoxynucleotidase YfbR-like HD superfamily hydrolase
MKELEQLKKLMHLKSVERAGEVDKRKESTADHVYGGIILAEHFLKKIKEPLDETKILKLLLYHDLVEIETGDFCSSNAWDNFRRVPRVFQRI